MSLTIISILCILLLLAYVFEISSALTKIPSVILLLLLGYGIRYITILFDVQIPDLNPVLPVLGTIGLILIVLEGSLDLELNRSKLRIINKSIINSLIPMIALAFLLAFLFQYFYPINFQTALINAIPFCVISSAVAIPSVKNLSLFNKEFVIYESSFSDIFGVIFFNYISLNAVYNLESIGSFGIQFFIIIFISFIAVLALSFLLSRITHHITFTPIILMVILIYAISKMYHLPALIFILIFGVILGNLDELKRFNWIKVFRPEKLDIEVKKFTEINGEATFIIRALFFILFGYLMDITEILNSESIPWAVVIISSLLIIRWIALRISGLPASPLLFVAPRGLITILLYISISPEFSFSIVNKSLIIQTILLSVIIMMFGLMIFKEEKEEPAIADA